MRIGGKGDGLIDADASVEAGRILSYADLGAPNGHVIFCFHGSPSSRLALLPFDAEFARRGLRVVCPDRPGHGRSSPQAARRLAGWPRDVEELAASLGIGSFAVAGVSGGGPHAVACAALSERVSSAAVISAITDFGWPGAVATASPMTRNVLRLGTEADVLAYWSDMFGVDGGGYLVNLGRAIDHGGAGFPEVDRPFLADRDAAAGLLASMREAFAQGVAGHAQDVWVLHQPWDFDVSAIRVPVAVFHGDLDANAPIAHGRHTAEMVPGARFVELSGHGHLSARAEVPRILEELVS